MALAQLGRASEGLQLLLNGLVGSSMHAERLLGGLVGLFLEGLLMVLLLLVLGLGVQSRMTGFHVQIQQFEFLGPRALTSRALYLKFVDD